MQSRREIDLPPVRVAYGMDVSDEFAAVVRTRAVRSELQTEILLDQRGGDMRTAMIPVAQRAQADVALDKAVLAAAMPLKDSMVRWIEAPLASPTKARKVLPSLLDIQLPFPLESCVYGFPVMEDGAAGHIRALAVAARKESVESRIARCEDAKVDPQCLDHEGLALWSQSVAEAPPTSDTRICAYLGVDRTVWVMGNSHRIESAHASQIGTTHLRQSEQAVHEWRDRVVRVIRAQTAPAAGTGMHWLWAGPGVDDASLIASLESTLEPLIAIRFSKHTEPATFLARALARRALVAEPSTWNFRVPPYTHPKMQQWRTKALHRAAWTALAAGLLLCALNLGFATLLARKDAEAARALTAETRALTGLPTIPRGQETVVAQRAMAEQEELIAPFTRALGSSQTGALQHVLQQGRAHGLAYESVTFREGHLLIQGTADDWDACERLARQLRDEGWTVNLDRQDAVAVEHVRFRINAGRTT